MEAQSQTPEEKMDKFQKLFLKDIRGFWSNEDEINWNSRRRGDSTIVGWDHWLNFLFIARSTC